MTDGHSIYRTSIRRRAAKPERNGKILSPCDDDEKVEAVPGVGEVGLSADEAHGRDLDDHLDGEEGEDGVVEGFEDSTAADETRYISARLKHAERDAVEQNHADADPLEPRAHVVVKE